MNLDRQLQRRKAAYVQAISDALQALPEHDREAVLEDVEDHIDSALYDGDALADMDRLEEILDSLGAPEAYAADVSSRLEHNPADAKICWMAPFGMVWSASALFIALPLMFAVRMVEVDGNGDPITPDASMAEITWRLVGYLALIGFIGGPTVSGMAISKIRAARGKLCGLNSAVIGLYLIPLAFVDVLLMLISFHMFNKVIGFSDDLSNLITLGFFVVLLYWNYQTVRNHRRKISSEIPNTLA